MSVKKTHWLRTTIIVLIICGIAGLALTSVLFFGNPDPTYATATLEFTFDGAADGIAPNGHAFDISGIASEEVLAAALKEASMEGTYTVQQLQDNLVARGVYPEDMAEKVKSYESLLNFTANREMSVGDFHPTTFDVALYNRFDPAIPQAKLEALLKGIMAAYRVYFDEVYANGLQTGSLLFSLEDYDYPQQLEILQGHYEVMASYANEMYEREPAYHLNGAGFNDIGVRLNNLITSDISRLNADLTMNALTRDTARLLTQYQFEIRDLGIRLSKQSERLEKLDALVDAYDKNEILYLSTSDSLTKIDGNSSETYDALIDERKQVADGITEINSQIATYQLMLSDLLKEDQSQSAKHVIAASTAAPTEGEDQEGITAEEVVQMTEEEIAEAAAEAERLAKAQTSALEKNIAILVEKGNAIIDDFKAMLTAYNDQEINDLTVTVIKYDYKTPKVLSGAFIKKAIKVAGPICAIGFMLCMALIVASRRKEEKRKTAA